MSTPTSRNLTILSIVASLLLLAIGMSGAWYVHVLQGRVSWALADNVTSIRAALRLQLAIREIRDSLEEYSLTHNRAFLDKAVGLQDSLKQAAADVTHFASTEFEFGIMKKMNDGLNRFLAQLREATKSKSAGSGDQTPPPAITDQILVADVLPYVKQYLDFNETELSDRSRDNEAMASWLVAALVLLGIGGAAAGGAAGYALARGIRRTVFQLSIPLRDVAGRLNQVVGPVEIDENPAIEDLEAVLKRIAAEVNAVIEKFHATHRQVLRADQLAALGQLAAGLAHELHNPLMSMKILVQSARAEGSAPLDRHDLRVLDEEISRLQELLQSFLTFAKPAKLERRDVDLRPVVLQTVNVLAARAARRHVLIQTTTPEFPVQLSADEGQLRQVTLNLLLNALDSVPDEGTISIEVGSGKRASFSDEGRLNPVPGVFLTVADNGHGLPSDDVERIFEPFFSTKETGLGLGLAICRRIVESHGGWIEASNQPEGGAQFLVFLPASAGPTAPVIAKPAAVEAALLMSSKEATHA
jgi:signal transduction histidine kinase